MSLFAELRRRKVFRVAAGYLISAWGLIQVVETVFPAFGLDDASFRILVIALAIGFIPVVVLAWAFELTRGGLRIDRPSIVTEPAGGSADSPPALRDLLRYPRFSVPVLALAVLAIGVPGLVIPDLKKARWAHMEAIPRIRALVDMDDFIAAFELASEAEQYIPKDPALADLWRQFAVQLSVESQPPGAQVSYHQYGAQEAEWKTLGTSPIEATRLPRASMVFRFENPGHPVTLRSRETFDGTLTVPLASGDSAADAVQVPARELFFLLTGFLDGSFEVPAFEIDRHEVSNAAFQEFVAAGGYTEPAYWEQLDFSLAGRSLSFDEAMSRFKDPTGRPGPSTWVGGTYPKGKSQFPVGGVSWFEAVAYAAFRERHLPTLHHWSAAALFPPSEEMQQSNRREDINGRFRGQMMAMSNFSGTGPAAVGSLDNPGPFGTYDLGGNVREWCVNAVGEGPGSERYILGGSWKDPSYLFTYGVSLSPWDRSETNGFRLVDPVDGRIADRYSSPVARPEREAIAPVPDEIYQVYAAFYDYDHTPLNATVAASQSDSPHWRQETVSFDATYGGERVIAHLFLPRNSKPPYQPVIYYPASNAIHSQSDEDLQLFATDFIIHSGRALVYPVLWGTHDRNTGLQTTWPENTKAYSDNVLRWIQDFRRTIDYIDTRDDLEIEQLGYFGWSWGGWNGPIVMALDQRIKAGVYVSGGIPPTLARPEASSASFASHVQAPVLMISGRHDVLRPVETFQKPMFESLGTPDELKRHAILEGGHAPPMNQLIGETLNWFDEHLGSVD